MAYQLTLPEDMTPDDLVKLIEDNEVSNIMIGSMGIKKMCQGDKKLYERKGGYIFIELATN